MEDDSSGCEKDKVRGSTQETEGAVNCIWMESWEATGNDKGLLRWCSGIESTCQCRRCGFDPWVRKVPWRRKWQPTPVFLPGKFHRQGSLVGYWPWGCKESDTTEWLITHTHGHTHTHTHTEEMINTEDRYKEQLGEMQRKFLCLLNLAIFSKCHLFPSNVC